MKREEISWKDWVVCEWCRKSDPIHYGYHRGVKVFGRDQHIICKDCYEHLEVLK